MFGFCMSRSVPRARSFLMEAVSCRRRASGTTAGTLARRHPRRLAVNVPVQLPPSAWNVPEPEAPLSLPV